MNDGQTPKMYRLQGVSAAPGHAVGPVHLVTQRDLEIPADPIPAGESDVHLKRSRVVLGRVEEELSNLRQSQEDSEIREILDAQIEIIRDPELFNRVEQLITKERRSAEYALYHAFNEFIQLLRQTGQEWVKDRIIDLQSLRNRLVYQSGGEGSVISPAEGAVLFAEELSPTEVIEYYETGIAGIVMRQGGATSHAAIIAQALDIPCLVGVDWKRTLLDRVTRVAVDATSGMLIIQPDEDALAEFRSRQELEASVRDRRQEIGAMPNRMACGTPFELQANIEFEVELQRLREVQANGVGLLRTETLFLRQGYFDADRQHRFYSDVLAGCGDHPVTIRLLDIGGDKLPGKRVEEANPFLGWRGVRMLLDEHDLLKRQLGTICRVAAETPGRIRVLVPMVSDVSEIRAVREIFNRVQEEMRKRGEAPAEPIPLGVMIEVPALAMLADEAARLADFFSIGSNDLTQYTMASDRGNERVNRLYNPGHPAVWKLIHTSMQAATRARIPISVCGEIAGHPVLAGALLGMGIRELSMNPASIPAVKQVICSLDCSVFRSLSDSLLTASGHDDSERILERWRNRYLNGNEEQNRG